MGEGTGPSETLVIPGTYLEDKREEMNMSRKTRAINRNAVGERSKNRGVKIH